MGATGAGLAGEQAYLTLNASGNIEPVVYTYGVGGTCCVNFTDNWILTSGLVHSTDAGNHEVEFLADGRYLVLFHASTDSQMCVVALMLNGVLVPGALNFDNIGECQLQVIIDVASGDVLTVQVPPDSQLEVASFPAGPFIGSSSFAASLTIVQVAD